MRTTRLRRLTTSLSIVTVLIAAGVASAQPTDPLDPDSNEPIDPWDGPETEPVPPAAAVPEPTIPQFEPRSPPLAKKLRLPDLFHTPTGHLLPAGVILGSIGVDTGGDAGGELRVGLGDVAEFGVGSTDMIRSKSCDSCNTNTVSPYPTALFKMGVAEGLLSRYQPALALGFRKSFEREHDNRKTRVAQLYAVASKQIVPRFHVHVGGVFWDAEIRSDVGTTLLHDSGWKDQLRMFGGIEIEPLPRSQIMLELDWAPEFVFRGDGNDTVDLRPVFSWGVRYALANWALVEAGVRIPDIKDINLIDAQIFGQVKFVSHRFSRFLEGLQ